MLIAVGRIGVVGSPVVRRGGGVPIGYGLLTLNGKTLVLNGKGLMLEHR